MNSAQRRIRHLKTDVYRVYGIHDELLYVGYSVNVFRRLGQHKPYAVWYPLADTVLVEQYANRAEACYVEAVAIRDEAPLHNVTIERAALYRLTRTTSPTPIDSFAMWRDEEGQWWVDG